MFFMNGELIYNFINGFYDENVVAPPDNMCLEDAFADGTECNKLLEKMYQAKLRLCEKIGVNEDVDVEIIFDSMEEIMKIISLKMYYYGKLEIEKDS